jgi:photosystem II stability/assembly factor-like uncharacterized protein
VDDLSFRAEFHRALDPMAPPAPWLGGAVRDTLRQRQGAARPLHRRLRARLTQPAWLLPAVAVFLAIAIIIAVIAGSRLLHFNQTIPVGPPQHGAAAPAGCPGWSASPQNGGSQPTSDRMVSASTGWATGALRTTDGGADWRRLLPEELQSDAPPSTNRRFYPPAYVDFFLDANHAWLAYAVPSPTSCFDHLTMFVTSDGGGTWRRSHPIDAAIQADTSLQLQLGFIDPKRGWMFVLANGRIAPDWFVYATADGGMDWQEVGQLPSISSFCGVTFIQPDVGLLGGCINTGGPSASLTVTRDAGRTWEVQKLPTPIGDMFTITSPYFFDRNRGVIPILASISHGNTSVSSDYLDVTDDGGRSWRALPPLPFTDYPQAFGYADPTHFLVLTTGAKGDYETIYRSADGGATWVEGATVPSMMGPGTPQFMFVDGQHGFVEETGSVGSGPAIFLATSDGGKTWRNMHPRVVA